MLGQHPLTQHPSLTAISETNSISPNISNHASTLSSFRALLLRQWVIQRQYTHGEVILSLCLKGVTVWIWTIRPGAHILWACSFRLLYWEASQKFSKERPNEESSHHCWWMLPPFSFLFLPSFRCHKVSNFLPHSSAMMCAPPHHKPQSLPNTSIVFCSSPSLFLSCSLSHKESFIYYTHPKNVLHMVHMLKTTTS